MRKIGSNAKLKSEKMKREGSKRRLRLKGGDRKRKRKEFFKRKRSRKMRLRDCEKGKPKGWNLRRSALKERLKRRKRKNDWLFGQNRINRSKNWSASLLRSK